MRDKYRHRISIIAGLLVLALLIGLTLVAPPDPANWLPGLLFGALTVFTMTFGVPLAGGLVSLMPMTVTAAYLVMGLVAAGWVTFVSVIIHGWVRYRWARPLTGRQETGGLALIGRTAINAAMHAASILAGGAVFQLCGGTTPLREVDTSTLLILALLGLVHLGVNYLIAGAYIATRGRAALRAYVHSLRSLVFYEGAPLVLVLLMAPIYARLGVGYFVLFALTLVVGSLIAHNLDRVNRRLGRRVKELDSLQAVGQALSASLDIETIVSAIYTQVAGLMPAREFYVALYDPETDEVSFPLAIEKGQRAQWRSRRAGNGLTEYVLHSRAPLLIQEDVERKVTELRLDHIGREAACWLGVPILTGTEPLGVIAVQSYDTSQAYDASHQKVLLTIAAQAAAAVQNARLYARTDEALARRVQELDSILRTTHEGFLLLDLDWCVLAANRTLADWVNVAQSELAGQPLDAPLADGKSLMGLISYTPEILGADCEMLAEGEWGQKQAVVLLVPTTRYAERTLTPVRDREGAITGWLLVFHDMTEQIELTRLKDDMTDMLVHDLRSPLTAVMGSVALMKRAFRKGAEERFEHLRTMAQQNSERILNIVNQLLDISKLESDQLPLQPETLDVEALLKGSEARLAPLAIEAQITLALTVASDLPALHADPSLIGRVLDNLLDNAIKFTPDGGQVRLWARRDPERAPEALLVGVTDTGPGIPPEAQSRLFAKFQQVTSVEGRRRGTGLGLALCKLAVEAHGGRIWVESEVGQGSTFMMTLPIVKRI